MITSTLPTKSSIVRYAICWPEPVVITLMLLIRPPIVCFEPFISFACPVSSSIRKSVLLAEICFSHIPVYSSSGCPVTYTPRTSFSRSSRSSFSNSWISGTFISRLCLSSSLTKSNSDICPEIASLFCLTALSIILS